MEIASKVEDPREASNTIVRLARQRWQQTGSGYIDDVTAVVVKLAD